jgi:hypothetical protein
MPGSLEWVPMSPGLIQNIDAIQVKSKEQVYVYRLLH